MAKSRRNVEKDKNKSKKSFREKLADTVEVSKEITLNVAKITIIGSNEASIENYGGILEYSENAVLVNSKPCPVKITGSLLEIAVMTKELLYIKGRIKKISFKDSAQKNNGR